METIKNIFQKYVKNKNDRLFIIQTFSIFFLISLFIYRSAFNGYFQQDEWFFFPYFQRLNIHRYLAPLLALAAPFRDPQAFAFHITPLGTFFWWLEMTVFKLNYDTYIATSLFLHSLISVMVVWIVNKISRSRIIALISGIFFLTLSTHYQAVTWVNAHINTQLSLLFGLISFAYFIEYLDKSNRKYYFYSIILLLASVLTKETTIVLFFILPFYTFLRKSFSKARTLYLFYFSTALYFVFRFISPLVIKLMARTPSDTSAISEKNKDILFSLYYGVSFFFKGIAQSLIPLTTISQFTEWIAEVGYPQYNTEKAIGGSTYLTFIQSVGQDLSLYFFAFILIFILSHTLHKYLWKKEERTLLSISYFWIAFSILPFTFLAGWLLTLFPYITSIDSRHLYVTTIGSCIVLALSFVYGERVLSKRFNNHKKLVRFSLVFIAFLWIWYHTNALQITIQKQNAITDDREEIVNLMTKLKPKLGKQTVFFSESNVALYGFAEYMIPFQNNPGQVIISTYSHRQSLPKPFLSPTFLMKGLTDQFYEEYEGMGIGYYLNKKALYQAVVSHNIDPQNIVAIGYDGQKHIVTNATDKIRKEVSTYLKKRTDKVGWKSYTNKEFNYNFLYPPEYQIVETKVDHKIMSSVSLVNINTQTPLITINIFPKGESEGISSAIAPVDDGSGTPIGEAYTFVQLEIGPTDKYTSTINKNQSVKIMHFFNTHSNVEIKQLILPAEQYTSSEEKELIKKILEILEFNN